MLLWGSVLSQPQESKPQANTDLAAANQQFQAGNFTEAIHKYQQALKAEPTLVPAQAGLIRTYLRTDQVDPAYDVAKSSLAANPNSAQLLAAMGNVQYRRAEIPESEASYKAALRNDPNSVEAYLGLARVFRTALLYRRAYDQIVKAHEIAPQDPAVQRAWFQMLPRRERIKALEEYLAGPHPDTPEENVSLHSWLEYLKATADQPVHACKLVSNVDKTETQLLIVNFKNEEGEDKSMTLELARPAVDSVLATINKETGKNWAPEHRTQTASSRKKSLKDMEVTEESKKTDGWWGDDYWKTTRNADKWNKPASTNKPAEKPASNDKQ